MTLPLVRPSVHALSDETVATRRDLHRHAELSTEEHRTQGLILERLSAIGADGVRAVADTGATALIRGALPGPNLLWRADIDALPLREETGLSFSSEGGKAMHACGHDGHVAIALAMASALQQALASLAGTVRFAFQPAEEHVGGAQRMIDEGIMDSPVVGRVFGLHIWATTPVGQVAITAGPVFAASTHFRIIIRGRGGHAAAPHEAVDPIVVAAHAIVALQTVVSRSVNPEETAVLTVGRIQGGVRGNIIPNEVMLSGTIRTFNRDVESRVVKRAAAILDGITAAWGATYQFDTSTLPAVVNDAECAALAAGAAGTLLGPEGVVEGRTTGGDDMAYFLEKVPGAYILLGGRKPGAGPAWPHHHPKFDFDEACLPLGVELGLRIIEESSGCRLT
jgi:amidohydrolase